MKNSFFMPGLLRMRKSAVIGVIMASFGGGALAATPLDPEVAKLEFKDAIGTIVMNTGYGSYAVDADNKGNVYVTDPVDGTLNVYNTNGRLVKSFKVNKALAVAVDNPRGLIYVSGANNGSRTIFVLDNNNDDKDDSGDLGAEWGQPNDMVVDSKSNLYVVDTALNFLKRIDPLGGIKNYGPYGGERYASELIDNTPFYRTRHRMLPLSAAIDEANNILYVVAREVIEDLRDDGATQPCSNRNSFCSIVEGKTSCEYNDYTDTEESWRYYNDVLKINTTASCKYWTPLATTSGSIYRILVIDMATGVELKRMKPVGNDTDLGLKPRGIATDGKGRLYVAARGENSAAGGVIKVYNADSWKAGDTWTVISPIGTFDAGIYSDVVFSPDATPHLDPNKAKGRLFATIGNLAASYGIDGGSNPDNTAPEMPSLLSPASKTYVTSKTPTFEIGNAFDKEADPLTYYIEIKNGEGATVASTGIQGGPSGRTSYVYDLTDFVAENQVYTWRAQAFDGKAGVWSGDPGVEFCVNERKDNPNAPVVLSPKGSDIVSPFSSSLLWSASTDPDCYDFISYYTVEVSSDPAFNSVQSFKVGGTSIKLADVAKDFIVGASYYWRVKAVDNNNDASDYSTGSFTFKTTVVSFSSDQLDTKVYIDGNYGYRGRLLGTAPLEVQNITPGSHFVTFVKTGYEPYYTVINVIDGGDPMSVPHATMVAASKIRPSAAGTELGRLEFGNASPFVVDYNNDSLKDVISGSADGKMYLFLSERQIVDGIERVVLAANGVVQAYDGSDLHVGSRSAPFVVDYNNDGKKDIVTGSGDGRVYLFLNTGSEPAPTFTSAGAIKDSTGNDIIVASNSTPAMTDYNNDGNKDMVIGSGEGTIRLYLNTGSDSSPVFDNAYTTIESDGVPINAGPNSKPFFTDWNSDGTQDLLVGGRNSLRIYLNNGAGGPPDYAYSSDIRDLTGGAGEAAPFVVDWDGTTARDIVVGNGLGGIVSYISACGGNVAGNIPPAAPVMREPAYGSYVMSNTPVLQVDNASDPEGCPLTYGYEVADINGNIVASDSGIAEGLDGKTSMTVNRPLLENATYFWRVQAFDGDTATGTTWSAPSTFWVNVDNDNPSVPAVISPVDNANATSFSTVLSWSQSVDPDKNDTISYHLEVSGDPSFGQGAVMGLSGTSIRLDQMAISMTNNGLYHWRVKAVDNHGGQSGYSGGSFVYRTSLTSFASDLSGAKVYIDGNYGYFGRLLGSAPLAVEGINPGSHFITFLKAGHEPVYKIINVADPLDNNGALTVTAVAEEWAKAPKIRPSATGSELFRTSGNSAPFVVDYNNDGLKDVIAGDASGNLYLYLSGPQQDGSGSLVLKEGALQDINVGSRAVPFVVDYNNDGKKDLLVGSGGGQIYLYLNTGDDVAPVFTSAETLKDSGGSDIRVSNSAPVVIDYNGDGRKDLVLGGATGALSLYINSGTDASPVLGTPVLLKADNSVLSVGTDVNSSVFFTDWNSDGKKDMVVGGASLRLYLNVGSDDSPNFLSLTALQEWIKDKKRERGNREFIPYLGYNNDLDYVNGVDVMPFVVDWSGTSAKDLVAGSGPGAMTLFTTE